jgi:hypothetical protein
MNIYLKLVKVQNELKAPKGQYNSFGKYHYRNQEDILEALKPLLLQHGLTLIIKDSIELVGDRYYVKATCVLIDTENGETLENTALARESVDKKGMDDSQITGSTSSYARKYALNGLFLIDDTKDADTDEFTAKTKATAAPSTYQAPKKPAAQTENPFGSFESFMDDSSIPADAFEDKPIVPATNPELPEYKQIMMNLGLATISGSPTTDKQLNLVKMKIRLFAQKYGINQTTAEEAFARLAGKSTLAEINSKQANAIIQGLGV